VAQIEVAIRIYGVISYSVVQRTREIGVRSALGASTATVVGLILKRGMLMAAAGLVLGLVVARDPLTIAAVAAILAFVALLACYVPARRAAKVDPMICLRYE
jgi:putative ABC transport system permease protein